MLSNMPSLDGAAILEVLPEGAILIDQDDRIRLINTAAVDILGIDAGAAVGRSITELPGGFVLDGADEKSEYLDLPDRWVRCRMTPLTVGAEPEVWNGTLILLDDVGRDILAHQRSADFVSALIHDLRVPLTRIRGHADILLLMDLPADTQCQFIGGIKANAGQLMDELSNLLTAYRIRSGQLRLEPEALDIVSVVREVAQTRADSYALQDLKLTIVCLKPEIMVSADQRSIRDILSNLLDNACRQSRPAGEVIVAIVDDDDGVRVIVQDANASCTSEELFAHSHIYIHQPLAVAQGLVRLHGGRLWAESIQGQGCKVSFTLPRAEP
jgi:signal transduction histidine kinase